MSAFVQRGGVGMAVFDEAQPDVRAANVSDQVRHGVIAISALVVAWDWGQGLWTDYGRELCRRATAILKHDF
jgi:hypothetical protein